jgi:hypothetical protein
VLQGLKDLIVVESDNILLICKKKKKMNKKLSNMLTMLN